MQTSQSKQGVEMLGVTAQNFLETGLCLAVPAQKLECLGQERAVVGVGFSEGNDPIEQGGDLCILLFLRLQVGEAAQAVGEIRMLPHHRPLLLHGDLPTAGTRLYQRSIVSRLRQVRTQFDGLVEGRQSFVKTSQGSQDISETVPAVRKSWRELGRLAEGSLGFRQPAPVLLGDAESDQGFHRSQGGRGAGHRNADVGGYQAGCFAGGAAQA